MAKKAEISGMALVRKVTHQAGGSVVVLENAKIEVGSDLLKDLAKAKAKDKELINFTIEKVQKTLIEE